MFRPNSDQAIMVVDLLVVIAGWGLDGIKKKGGETKTRTKKEEEIHWGSNEIGLSETPTNPMLLRASP